MTGAEVFAYVVALISALATAIVQAFSGVDLGEAVYDGLTVGFSSLSVVTGAVVVARSVQDLKVRGKDLAHGNLWTLAAFLALSTTGLSFYHSWLMLYWAFEDLHAFAGPEVEAAFRNWHVMASATFSLLHLFLYRVMKGLKHPDSE